MFRKISAALFILIVALVFFVNNLTNDGNTKSVSERSSAAITGNLKISFIDVGQGDSILVQTGSNTMLIDAGTREDAGRVIKLLEQSGIKKLDVVIATHPHEDHIGGMDDVIKQFDIGKLYMPKVTSNTKTWEDMISAVKRKGLDITAPIPGSSFKLGEAVCTILAPNSSKYEEFNDYSIVFRLVYGKNSFMFTGDAQVLSEKEMLAKGYELKSDLLKVGHHGSNGSTSDEFLDVVNPGYAVISCGKGNDYGHPHKETMDKLEQRGVKVYRTDESGTIVCSSDGENISFNVNQGSYLPGEERK